MVDDSAILEKIGHVGALIAVVLVILFRGVKSLMPPTRPQREPSDRLHTELRDRVLVVEQITNDTREVVDQNHSLMVAQHESIVRIESHLDTIAGEAIKQTTILSQLAARDSDR